MQEAVGNSIRASAVHTQHRLPDVSDVGTQGITVNRLSMMRALDTPYPISIPNESTGRASSRFLIRCLRVALTNPRNSTPLPAYDACYTIECGFHCATDCLPPIQIAIVRSSRSPRVHVSTRLNNVSRHASGRK